MAAGRSPRTTPWSLLAEPLCRIVRKQTGPAAVFVVAKREPPTCRHCGRFPRGQLVGMRQLARRFSRVADSSASSPAEDERRGGVDDKAPRASAAAAVPEGHVPVHVGEVSDGEVERFLVRAELLGRPALAHLLGRAAQEYGYDHHGPLRIPCSPAAFRRALASLDS